MQKIMILSKGVTRLLPPHAYQRLLDGAIRFARQCLRSERNLNKATQKQLTSFIDPDTPSTLKDLNGVLALMEPPIRVIKATAPPASDATRPSCCAAHPPTR